jgi:hypothetical protein
MKGGAKLKRKRMGGMEGRKKEMTDDKCGNQNGGWDERKKKCDEKTREGKTDK